MEPLLRALLFRDAAPPILLAHSVRAKLNPGTSTGECLEECRGQLEAVVPKILEEPRVYVADQIELTRVSSNTSLAVRRQATGCLFHRNDDAQSWVGSLNYTFLWAEDLVQASGGTADLSGKIGATFAVRNTHRIALHGRFGEGVIPIVVLNSDIERVLLSFDLQAEHNGNRYVVDGKQLFLVPKRRGCVEVFQGGVNRHSVSGLESPLNLGSKLGEITLIDGRISADPLKFPWLSR